MQLTIFILRLLAEGKGEDPTAGKGKIKAQDECAKIFNISAREIQVTSVC